MNKKDSYRCLYSREFKAFGGSHFSPNQIWINKTASVLLIMLTFSAFSFIILVKIVDFETDQYSLQ